MYEWGQGRMRYNLTELRKEEDSQYHLTSQLTPKEKIFEKGWPAETVGVREPSMQRTLRQDGYLRVGFEAKWLTAGELGLHRGEMRSQ